MADNIEGIIFKLQLDESGYIRGVDAASASTQRFSEVQQAANKALQILEGALSEQSKFLQQSKKDLDAYIGTDEKYRKQLEKTFKDAQAQNRDLTDLVIQARKEYEAATAAAQEFADTSKRAADLQAKTTGGKIPTPTALPPSAPAALSAQIFNTVNLTEFGELADITAQTKIEFDELRDSIALAEERLKQLNVTDDEFKQLVPIVEAGKKALADYDNATKQAAGSQISLRTQITQSRNELVRLEEAGQGASQEYINLEKKVVQLTKAFNDQQDRIKVLASDTRALDFGKAAITSAISGFQAYTAVTILAGEESEDLQKKTMQLFAAMQLLTSLEQIANQVKKGGVLITNLQSAAQATYTAVVNASATALGRFRLALIATGIGAAVVAIGFLISKLSQLGKSSDEAARKQKILSDVVKESASSYTDAFVEVEKLKDQFELASKGIGSQRDALVKYNETLGLTVGFATDFKDAEQKIINNGKAYIEITKLKAESNLLLAKSAEANLKLDEALAITIDKSLPAFVRRVGEKRKAELIREAQETVKNVDELFDTITDRIQKKTVEATGKTAQQLLAEQQPIQGSVAALKKKIQDQIADLDAAFAKLSATNTEGQKKNLAERKKLQEQLDALEGKERKAPRTGAKSEIENVFIQERANLEAKLKELRASEVQSIAAINDEFAAKLETERIRIEKLIKDKKILGDLTKPLTAQPKTQAGILFAIQIQINEEEKQKKLDKLKKDILDAQEKLNDDLRDLQNKNIQDTLNLIQEEFQRKAALIDFNEKREIENARENVEDRLTALELSRDLVGEQAYQDAKNRIVQAGEDEQTNIIVRAAQARQELAVESIKNSLEAFEDITLNLKLVVGGNELEEIQALSDRFLRGKITYEKYKKDLAAIQKKYEDIELQNTIDVLEKEIVQLKRKITNTLNLTVAQYDELIRIVKEKELELQAARKGQATGAATTKGEGSPEAQRIIEYANAIGSLTDSVIGFWQKANEAEAAALDRSIQLQEQRVSAAQRIAERGNASYLKAESDRLQELQVIRENAARRDLAINAALQASQLLVGITGAIAKIASGIGAAETIASIAVIVGALATGYGLVRSLQGNQPRLFKGTPEVKREGHPQGRDTIPAWLTEGEAVIPQEANKKYKKSVEAIYHGKVPAEVLNEFVENYVSKKVKKEDSFINKYTKDVKERKVFETVQSVFNTVNNKINNTKDVNVSYSDVIDRTFSENKSLVENKNVVSLVRRIVNEVTDRKISIQDLTSFIRKYTKSEEYKKSIGEVVTKNIYKSFVENIEKVPAKVLNNFIENYSKTNVLRELVERHEKVIPAQIKTPDKPTVKAVFDGKIQAERVNNFVKEYHTIKPVPQLNYEKIRETAETHITQDGKLAQKIEEQNRLIIENNDLQRQTLRAMKNMSVSANIDRNGVAIAVNEYIEQMKIDRKT